MCRRDPHSPWVPPCASWHDATMWVLSALQLCFALQGVQSLLHLSAPLTWQLTEHSLTFPTSSQLFHLTQWSWLHPPSQQFPLPHPRCLPCIGLLPALLTILNLIFQTSFLHVVFSDVAHPAFKFVALFILQEPRHRVNYVSSSCNISREKKMPIKCTVI